MQIHLAGVPGGGSSGDCKRERELNPFWEKRLWSYYWIIKDKGKMPKENKIDLFMDSGAFSAWTQGKDININEYIQFIKENQDVINIYANLDVIGIGGKQPNKLTAEKTLENQKIMEKAGLSPVPVFHFGEPFPYLKDYCDKYEYIALGVAGNIGAKLIPWLDKCFSEFICDEKGYPKAKIHGFAVTSLKLMLRYPWYSVDSTSWVITGRMGSIFVPCGTKGEWIYNKTPRKISVSLRNPNIKDEGQHINTFSPMEQEVILSYIHKKGYCLGKSKFKEVDQSYELQKNERWFEKKPVDKLEKREVEVIIEDGISNRYQLRDEMNIIYFLDLEKSMPEWPWPFTQHRKMKKFEL